MATKKNTGEKYSKEQLLDFYRTMVRIREFEEHAAECFTKGMLAGNIHLSIGQEAAEAGAFAAIEEKDFFTSTHRGHGHAIARGMDPKKNMAATWKLPMVWFIENNCYGVSTEIHRVTNTPDLASRAAAYNVPFAVVDGTNPTEVYEAMKTAMEHARAGKGPYVVEAKVYRYQGHYCGDPAVYRPKEYMEHALANDGIEKLGKRLNALGVKDEELEEIKKAAKEEMDEAVKFADESPYPDPSEVTDDMYTADNERCVAR